MKMHPNAVVLLVLVVLFMLSRVWPWTAGLAGVLLGTLWAIGGAARRRQGKR